VMLNLLTTIAEVWVVWPERVD